MYPILIISSFSTKSFHLWATFFLFTDWSLRSESYSSFGRTNGMPWPLASSIADRLLSVDWLSAAWFIAIGSRAPSSDELSSLGGRYCLIGGAICWYRFAHAILLKKMWFLISESARFEPRRSWGFSRRREDIKLLPEGWKPDGKLYSNFSIFWKTKYSLKGLRNCFDVMVDVPLSLKRR